MTDRNILEGRLEPVGPFCGPSRHDRVAEQEEKTEKKEAGMRNASE